MSEGAKISGITIELGKKEIQLAPDQAEMLYKALDKMFGEKVITRIERIVERDRYPHYPWRWCFSGDVYNSSDTGGSVMARYVAKNETLCLSAK